MGMDHRTSGTAGVGPAHLLSSRPAPWNLRSGRPQSSSAHPAGGYGGGGGYYDLPLGRGTSGVVYGGFGGHDGRNRLGGAVRGLGMGMSNGVPRPVVRPELEDLSLTTRAHSSPLRPISFVETLSIVSLALDTTTV